MDGLKLFEKIEDQIEDYSEDILRLHKNEIWIILVCCFDYDLAGNSMFKVNTRNTRTRWEICSKLTINTPERRQWHRSCVFIVNF